MGIPHSRDRGSDVLKLDLRPLEDLAISRYVPAASLTSLHAGEDLALAFDEVPDRSSWRRPSAEGLKVGVHANRRVRAKARPKVVDRGRAEVLVSAWTRSGEARTARRRPTIAG